MTTELSAAMELAELNVHLEAIFGRPMWFSKAGHPLTFSQGMELFSDRAYCRISVTRIKRINRRRWTRCTLSTVWLGLDHGFGLDGPPVIFETMIFGGPMDGYQRRYTSEEDAIRGHASAKSRLAMAIYLRIHDGRSSLVFREPKPKPRYKYRTHDRRRS